MVTGAGTARFEADLFISYAHLDNKPLSSNQLGWITRFHQSLEALLSMRLGREAKIWRDQKLHGNDKFDEEIVDQFSNAAVLVSVITPRYLNSDWCTKEIREFCARAETHGGVVIANKARVFKVLKLPVETQDSLPDVVKDLLGYEFFRIEHDTPMELDPDYGEAYGQEYNRKVVQLAADAAKLVDKLMAGARAEPAAGSANANGTGKPVVYLAECSLDRRQERELLVGELGSLGYAILPDRELPLDDEEGYVAAVESLLARCGLAVHLVGARHGVVPDGPSEKSTVELQNELAARRSESGALQRVIWLPEGTQSDNPAQQAFIESLHNDREAQLGADLITGDFESLKTTIYATLERLNEKAPEDGPAKVEDAAGAGLIYLICTSKDRLATVPIRKYLHEQGFEVEWPAFEGGAKEIRSVHEQLLADCEAVLLYYGAGDEAWKRVMDSELRKLGGSRDKPLLAYTYLADPETDDKKVLLAVGEDDVIDGQNGSVEAALSAFVQAVASGAAAR